MALPSIGSDIGRSWRAGQPYGKTDRGWRGLRLTGLRLRGPDPNIEPEDCGGHDAKGIYMEASSENEVEHMDVEIDNNELWAWPALAISIRFVGGVQVHHNYIHHNRRRVFDWWPPWDNCRDYGLGYLRLAASADRRCSASARCAD